MTEEKKSLVEMFKAFLSSDETKLAEEVKDEDTKEVELESVLEDGTYELADGRSIVIEGGNVTEVLPKAEEEEEAPAEEEEMSTEADKKAEEAKLSEDKPVEKTEAEIELAKMQELTKDLQSKITKLEEAKPLGNAPQKKAKQEPIKLTSEMDLVTKARVRRYNRKIK